jgi:hypothetical protein
MVIFLPQQQNHAKPCFFFCSHDDFHIFSHIKLVNLPAPAAPGADQSNWVTSATLATVAAVAIFR